MPNYKRNLNKAFTRRVRRIRMCQLALVHCPHAAQARDAVMLYKIFHYNNISCTGAGGRNGRWNAGRRPSCRTTWGCLTPRRENTRKTTRNPKTLGQAKKTKKRVLLNVRHAPHAHGHVYSHINGTDLKNVTAVVMYGKLTVAQRYQVMGRCWRMHNTNQSERAMIPNYEIVIPN